MNQNLEKVSEYFTRHVKRSGLTHLEIAEAAGIKSVNMISMMMKGAGNSPKIPIERIPALADILDMDVKEFFERAMREYEPEKWKVIERIQGREVTENESEIIDLIREFAGKRRILKVLTESQKNSLQAFVESLYSAKTENSPVTTSPSSPV